MRDSTLFTVGIVAYKNYRYVKEAIDSVFMQDYGNIELIISNDGSDDFDEAEILNYIGKNKPDNIKKFRVNNNEYNLGTCKHLNKVKEMASGQYIMFMAADDAFYDKTSVSKIVRAFQENSDPLFVSGRCGMYDVNLLECDMTVPVEDVRDKLINLSPEEMYRALSTDMFIPTAATIYNMKAFDILGDFDERVFLVEDWAFFLKASRSGYKPYYLNEIISKHRDGGTAHGNASGVSLLSKKFLSDEITIMEIELLPYKDILGKNLYKRLENRYWDFKARYAAQYGEGMSLSWKLGKLLRRSPRLVVSMGVKGIDYLRVRYFQPQHTRQRFVNYLFAALAFLVMLFCARAAAFDIPYGEYAFWGVLLLFALNIALYILGLAVNFIGLCIDIAYKLYAKLFRHNA